MKRLYEKVIDAAVEMAGAELLDAQQSKIEAEKKFIETMKETPGLIDAYKKRLERENK